MLQYKLIIGFKKYAYLETSVPFYIHLHILIHIKLKPRTLSQGGGRFNGIMKCEVLVATPHNCIYN